MPLFHRYHRPLDAFRLHCRPRIVTFRGMGTAPKYKPYKHSVALDLAPKKKQPLKDILSFRGYNDWKTVRKSTLKIDGETILGKHIRPSQTFNIDIAIQIDEQIIEPVPALAVYNKPTDILCTLSDPLGREGLNNLVRRWPFLQSMHPVVRSAVVCLSLCS